MFKLLRSYYQLHNPITLSQLIYAINILKRFKELQPIPRLVPFFEDHSSLLYASPVSPDSLSFLKFRPFNREFRISSIHTT